MATLSSKELKRGQLLILGALLVIVLIADGLVVYRTLVSQIEKRSDYYPRWEGVRAMLLDDLNPYSGQVTERIQMGMFGRLAQPGEHQPAFLYPAFIAFTIPHFLLPYPLSLTLWIVTQQVFLVTAIGLLFHNVRRKLAFLAVLVIAIVLFRFNMMILTLGQFTLHVLFFAVLAYWLWIEKHYVLAGCALAQITIKPQLAILLIPLWLLFALKEKRWDFVLGFALSMGALLVLPAFFTGNWLDDFFFASNSYQRSSYEYFLSPQVATVIHLGLILVLWPICLLLWLQPRWSPLNKVWAPRSRQTFGYLISLTVVVTALTTSRIRNYDMAIMTLVIVLGLILLMDQRSGLAHLARALIWGVLVLVPWLLWYLAQSSEVWVELNQLVIPGLLLIALILIPLAIWARAPRQTSAN
jgi:hypothetical protein